MSWLSSNMVKMHDSPPSLSSRAPPPLTWWGFHSQFVCARLEQWVWKMTTAGGACRTYVCLFVCCGLSFFLSWGLKTQQNHWTHRVNQTKQHTIHTSYTKKAWRCLFTKKAVKLPLHLKFERHFCGSSRTMCYVYKKKGGKMYGGASFPGTFKEIDCGCWLARGGDDDCLNYCMSWFSTLDWGSMRASLRIKIRDYRWFAFTSFAFLFRKEKYVKKKKAVSERF